jgi:glucose-1-phosphate thymidylyltransferase
VTNSIVGPHVHIGEKSTVMGSIVGPYVSLSPDSHVVNSIVRDSIINEGSLIEAATLSSSLIGQNATVRGAFERLNVGDSSEIDSSMRIISDQDQD